MRLLRYGAWQMEILFLILGYFLRFCNSNRPSNKHFEEMKKKSWRYHYLTYVDRKLWSDDLQFLRYGPWQTGLLFFILDTFLHFYRSNSWSNQIFLKIKKTRGDIIIFNMCTKNYDQMIYGFRDMVRVRYIYFSF